MSKQPLSKTLQFTRKKVQQFSYGLSEVIGKGYSSQVYKGRNDETNENVAVKVIDLKMLKNDINRTLLESEINILKELKSLPNILHLHQVYTTKNNTYIVTELCDSDLSKHIKRKLTEPEVYAYMAQLMNGYHQFQQRDIIHRDLKPANLLIADVGEGVLKVADFGFAVKVNEVIKPSKYNVGSPLYMAPQSLKRNEYSFKSDLWSIGIIFFEMLTSETPWKAKNEKELIKKIENDKIEDILSKKNLSPMSKDFIMLSLRLERSARMCPEDVARFDFSKVGTGSILMEKKLNTSMKPVKPEGHQSLTSPKAHFEKSVENKEVYDRRSSAHKGDQSENYQLRVHKNASVTACQNISTAKRDHTEIRRLDSPKPHTPNKTEVQQKQPEAITKDEKKTISKILISQVHFCRFLYKLLQRIKQSQTKDLLHGVASLQCEALFQTYTNIIHSVIHLLMKFESENYLKCQRYEDYKLTIDYKKLMKIARQYNDRYSAELREYWTPPQQKISDWAVEETAAIISILSGLLAKTMQSADSPFRVQQFSKDIIILDYLLTARQLLEMFQNGYSYEQFAKKSRIEEIVQGKSLQINQALYERIMARANELLRTAPVPLLLRPLLHGAKECYELRTDRMASCHFPL